MSLQLTLARAERTAAQSRWRKHLDHCGTCTRRRAGAAAVWCPAGQALRIEVAETERAAEDERRHDQAPAPGQAPLW